MQCLQTEQLDPIPLSPKLPGFDTCFGAAFCHACYQLCLQRGLGKQGHSPAPLDLQIPPGITIGTSRAFQKASSMVQHNG